MRKLAALLSPLLWSLRVACVECSKGGSEEESEASADKDDLFFAYFESPLVEDEAFGTIGPSAWKNLFRIEPNFCGGHGQVNGFGQSPIVIPNSVAFKCDRNVNEYSFTDGNCKFEDLEFEVTKDGLSVGPKLADADTEHPCNLGAVKIPGNDNSFEAVEIRMKLGSEHSHEGIDNSAELQVYFLEEEEIRTAISIILEIGPFNYSSSSSVEEEFTTNEQPFYEMLLDGWEASSNRTEEFCALNPKGTGVFSTNTALKSQQQRTICPEIGSGIDPSNVSSEVDPSVQFPANLFKGGTLIESDNYGFFSYRGSLTTPPCTENINWNIADQFMFISFDQFIRTQKLILCFVERSTCEHASAASQFGKTSRPPQPLNGRQVVHYCPNNKRNTTLFIAPEIPEFEMEEEGEAHYAILYPWFVSLLSVFIYYILTRYVHGVPYTAVLFLLGTFMGVGIAYREGSHDQLTTSTAMWDNIDSELLLLVFLPGLLFKDAYGLDVHLFTKAFGQVLIMGFPMVLAGTTLSALVGKYVLPYNWGFNLAMTFGAIVSATDPVAVSALLNELGAPPRLKILIAGESLLNDGSAFVFFVIFRSLFFFDINVHGGEDISVGGGFALFFKIALGSTAVGIAFGFLLMFILYILKRRFNNEESIVQVAATVTVAYLSYYVAEVVLHFSGIIAVVFCGIITKAFASTLITDQVMMTKFWSLLEHLLNTILFALGGVVWGTVISNEGDNNFDFTGKDFGYFILVYVLLTVIRFFLFFIFYPIISRIGLKTNKEEAIFQAFGGLRGAVGIALAIALDNEVRNDTVQIDPNRDFTRQLFAIIGWIALLTLFVNGILAGPLLRYLKLGRASVAREKVTDRYKEHFRLNVLDKMIILLGEMRFADLELSFITMHVSCIAGLTCEELKIAVRHVKESTALRRYKAPNLSMFDGEFEGKELESCKRLAKVKMADVFRCAVRRVNMVKHAEIERIRDGLGSDIINPGERSDNLTELRLLFIELVRHAYQEDMAKGEVDVREELVIFGLNESVAIAEDEVTNGNPIADWDSCQRFINTPVFRQLRKYDPKRFLAYDIHIASAFIQAHEEAEQVFMEKFCKPGLLTTSEISVIDENSVQIEHARAKLNTIDPYKKKRIMTRLMATILLNSQARDVADHVERGLLKETEGEHILEHIEEELGLVRSAK